MALSGENSFISEQFHLRTGCRGGVAPAAPGVYETEAAGLARPVAPPVGEALLTQRLAGDANPLLPFGWGLRRVLGVEEQVPAAWTAPSLRLQQTQAELVQGRGNSSAPPVSPVLSLTVLGPLVGEPPQVAIQHGER